MISEPTPRMPGCQTGSPVVVALPDTTVRPLETVIPVTVLRAGVRPGDEAESVGRDPLEGFSVDLFGMGLDGLAACLELVPEAEQREWLDQRLARQGFVRDADGTLQFPRRDHAAD